MTGVDPKGMPQAGIDAAAKHLRETMQAGKKLTPWETTPKATKKKWLALAEGTLQAAALTPLKGEPVAWRVLIRRRNGMKHYVYTEQLPYAPLTDDDVEHIYTDPEPLFASQPLPETEEKC